MKSGLFIVFEGTEGSGKSTLMEATRKKLETDPKFSNRFSKTIVTREPGGCTLSEKIRNLILAEKMSPWCELFLYEAARAEHVAVTIRPELERGAIVLCDRFTDSSLAYQAHARSLDWETVKNLNKIATQSLSPDLVVLLEIDPEVGLKRAKNANRFEEEGVPFHEKVKEGFRKARNESNSEWIVLDAASKSPEEMADAVVKKIGESCLR